MKQPALDHRNLARADTVTRTHSWTTHVAHVRRFAAFQSGRAWFSPLDGEWSLRFGPQEARQAS